MAMFSENMFYPRPTEEQLADSPSRRNGIDESTENALRLYGSTLIQEASILLKLPHQVTATGMILFHRFYCMQSFTRFNVNTIAASCTWLASKFKENPREATQVAIVFHRMGCRRKNLPVELLNINSMIYAKLKRDLIVTESWVLKELGFICHVEYPHTFVLAYLSTLEARELTQEAWNIANDCLCTTLCVRFKAEVIACAVVYAAARRFQVPLPENPPWWEVFEADKCDIEEICRVMSGLYSIPEVKYIPVYGDCDAFTVSGESWDLPPHAGVKKGLLEPEITWKTAESAATLNAVGFKEVLTKAGINNLKENCKIGDDSEIRSLERYVRVDNGRFAHPFPTEDKKIESTKKRKREETVSKSCSRYMIDDMRGSRYRIEDVRGERHKQRQRERKGDKDRGKYNRRVEVRENHKKMGYDSYSSHFKHK